MNKFFLGLLESIQRKDFLRKGCDLIISSISHFITKNLGDGKKQYFYE